jgi:hypothetical protein
MLKKIKEGSIVQLWPGDTHKKVGKIISINEFGFEFQMVEGTSEKSDYKVGDILFLNHSTKLSLILIK